MTQTDWKNTDDVATAFSSSPITAGANSFDKWQCGKFSGTYNTILNGKWAHTAGTLPSNVTLFGAVNPSGGYTTPAITSNANLSDITSITAIGSGATVQFGATGPEAAGKAASTTANPAYTQWLTTQLRTTGSAAPGNIGSITLTLQYDEN